MKQGKIARVIVGRLETGDDILEGLTELVIRQKISTGSISALGAVDRATVGYFVGNGSYTKISLEGPLEVLSCVGNVSWREGSPYVHAHITLSDKEGRAYGGHLMPGCKVGATFEYTLHAYDDIKLQRKFDAKTKLFLMDV